MHPITTNAARGTAIQGSHRGVARSSPSRERTSPRTVTLEGEVGGETPWEVIYPTKIASRADSSGWPGRNDDQTRSTPRLAGLPG